VSRVPTDRSFPICSVWGMTFYVEAGGLKDISKDVFAPAWIVPRVADAAPKAPPAKKKKVAAAKGAAAAAAAEEDGGKADVRVVFKWTLDVCKSIVPWSFAWQKGAKTSTDPSAFPVSADCRVCSTQLDSPCSCSEMHLSIQSGLASLP
jgi:hypothetical protein